MYLYENILEKVSVFYKPMLFELDKIEDVLTVLNLNVQQSRCIN